MSRPLIHALLALLVLAGCSPTGRARGGPSGSQSSAGDDDDSAMGDDDDSAMGDDDDSAMGDDDDSVGDDDDSVGDDDDSAGDDDDSVAIETIFLATPGLTNGTASAIVDDTGASFWQAPAGHHVAGLSCGPTPGVLLAMTLQQNPLRYTLHQLDAGGGVLSSALVFDSTGSFISTSGAHPEVTVCQGEVHHAIPRLLDEEPSQVLVAGQTLWAAPAAQDVGGLACDPGGDLAITTMDTSRTWRTHIVDNNGNTLSTTTPFAAGDDATRFIGAQPETVFCDGSFFVARPETLAAEGGERSPAPAAVVDVLGNPVWEAPTGEDVGGLACDQTGTLHVTVLRNLPLEYDHLEITTTGVQLSRTPYLTTGGTGFSLGTAHPEVAVCAGFE